MINYDFEKVYSSDLLRAKQTCEEFTSDYIEDARLREVYRVLIGGPIKEGTPKDREKNDKLRANEFLNEILENNQNVLIFCHGNIIKYYLNKVLKSEENLWESITINNCSISILEFEDDELKIGEINLTNHLSLADLKKKEDYID